MEAEKMDRRLALVTEHENVGDDCADIREIDVDPNAVSDLAFRLKVSRDLLDLQKQVEQHRRILNKIILRAQLEGKPLVTEKEVA
jgi:hypothetical protein